MCAGTANWYHWEGDTGTWWVQARAVNTLRGTRWPHLKNHPAPNVKGAEVEKPRSWPNFPF